jgi:hypothetical protein
MIINQFNFTEVGKRKVVNVVVTNLFAKEFAPSVVFDEREKLDLALALELIGNIDPIRLLRIMGKMNVRKERE